MPPTSLYQKKEMSMQKNKIYLVILSMLTVILFIKNELVKTAILSSCNLFLTKVFPSLFPMLIICDLFIYFGLPEILVKILGKVFSKLFHTSPYGAFAFFMSLFSGTPANAYIIRNLVEQNKLNKEEAEYIFSFSFFSNPLFLYTMLNFIFPGKTSLILKLLIAPYITNLIIAFLTRPKKKYHSHLTINHSSDFLAKVLIESIKKSMNTMLMILGAMTFFFILNALLNPLNNPFLSGIFEISQGLYSIGITNFNFKIKECFTLLFISFGGLSIHLQIKSILNDTDISLKYFFRARFLQCLLSLFWLFI